MLKQYNFDSPTKLFSDLAKFLDTSFYRSNCSVNFILSELRHFSI